MPYLMQWSYVFLALTHRIMGSSGQYKLTHWGWVMHLCVSKLTIIGSGNGLLPGPRWAIIWTNAAILLMRTLGTNFNEISSEIQTFSVKKIHLKMSSAKWQPFCLGLNVFKDMVQKSEEGDQGLF